MKILFLNYPLFIPGSPHFSSSPTDLLGIGEFTPNAQGLQQYLSHCAVVAHFVSFQMDCEYF